MEVPSYRSSRTSVFSAAVKCVESYFHWEQTADCSLLVSGRKERKLWSQPALACFTSKATLVPQTPQTNHSRYSSPIETLNLIVCAKSQPVEFDNSTIGSYMCSRGERKACSYVWLQKISIPPHGGFFPAWPPTPQIFHFRGLHVTPPTPWNFHDFSTWSPLPLGNSKSTNKETSLIYFYLLRAIIKFSRNRLQLHNFQMKR